MEIFKDGLGRKASVLQTLGSFTSNTGRVLIR